jgi:hypothetical protein
LFPGVVSRYLFFPHFPPCFQAIAGAKLCYKIIFMTRNTFFSILSGLILLINSLTASAAANTASSKAVHSSKEVKTVNPANSKGSASAEEGGGLPAANTEASLEKHQKPVTEELAHIHHFHKERVKKIKRHHKKYWALSKLILILCHLALLVIAYLHLSH